MKTIHKYILNQQYNVLNLPEGSSILSFGSQREDIVLWVLLNDSFEMVPGFITLNVYGTGWQIPEDKSEEFKATVQLSNGMVFHIFEQLHD